MKEVLERNLKRGIVYRPFLEYPGMKYRFIGYDRIERRSRFVNVDDDNSLGWNSQPDHKWYFYIEDNRSIKLGKNCQVRISYFFERVTTTLYRR